jgi:hypothetical protein
MIVVANTLAAVLIVAEIVTLKPMKTLSPSPALALARAGTPPGVTALRMLCLPRRARRR